MHLDLAISIREHRQTEKGNTLEPEAKPKQQRGNCKNYRLKGKGHPITGHQGSRGGVEV
jgi:hypothetical protein